MSGRPPLNPNRFDIDDDRPLSDMGGNTNGLGGGYKGTPGSAHNYNERNNDGMNGGFRSHSRGSFLDELENNEGMGMNPTKNNPLNLRSIKTTIDNRDHLISKPGTDRHPGTQRRDPDNPLGYKQNDNLRKVRNDAYIKHNYGHEADDPFKQMQLQEMDNEDVSEAEKIRRMEKDYERQREEISKAKMKLEQKQLYDLQEKEERLIERMEDIKREKDEEDQMNDRLRQEIVRIKIDQKKEEEERNKVERMMWNLDRDNQMELIVRKKLELEKLQENSKYLEDLKNRRKMEIDEIDNEIQDRDAGSAELLQKALNHADTIQELIESGVLDKEYQAKLVNALSGNENDQENKQLREELLEELRAKISQQQEMNSMKNAEFIQELNMKRMEFSDAEKKINEQRLLHEALERKGLEFNVDLEMETGPPMDYVIKNLDIKEKDVNKKHPFSIVEVVENTKTNLGTNAERLRRLREEKKETDHFISTNEYVPKPIFLSDNTKEVIEYVLDDIMNRAIEEISMYDNYVDGIKRRVNILKIRQPVQEARVDYYSDRISMKNINTEIVNNVVIKMIKEIVGEVNGINEMAKLTALNIIVKSFKVQQESDMDENTLAGVLMNMQQQHNKERHRDIHKIHHKLVAASNKVFMRPNNIKTEEKKKKADKQPKDIIEEKDKKDDNEAIKLDPNLCEKGINSAEVKGIERELWSRIEETNTFFFGGTMGKSKGGVTALEISNNGRIASIGIDNGVILIYDLITEPPSVSRVITGIKCPIKSITISDDSYSQLM